MKGKLVEIGRVENVNERKVALKNLEVDLRVEGEEVTVRMNKKFRGEIVAGVINEIGP